MALVLCLEHWNKQTTILIIKLNSKLICLIRNTFIYFLNLKYIGKMINLYWQFIDCYLHLCTRILISVILDIWETCQIKIHTKVGTNWLSCFRVADFQRFGQRIKIEINSKYRDRNQVNQNFGDFFYVPIQKRCLTAYGVHQYIMCCLPLKFYIQWIWNCIVWSFPAKITISYTQMQWVSHGLLVNRVVKI